MIEVIRKPEITKKISTPTKPLRSEFGKAWKATTERTATALSPSISGLYFVPTNELDSDAATGACMPSSLSSILISQYFFSFQDFFEVQLRREIGRDLI